MKKGIFATVAIFASLALVACGSNSTSTKHTHSWTEWKEVKAATCEEKGEEKRTCKCGQEQTRDISAKGHTLGAATQTKAPTCKEEGEEVAHCSVCNKDVTTKIAKLEHTWDDGVASGDCGEAGKITYTCTACGETQEEVTGYIQHSWSVTGSVEAADGGLKYDLVTCSKCHKNGLIVSVKNEDGTNNMTVTGSPKGSPAGTVKLGAANDYIMGAIKLDAAKTGKLYMRGSMDYWYTSSNQNEQKGIYNGKGVASKDDGIANFKMEVGADADNLTEVALTADKDLLYKDFLPEEVGFTGVEGTDWSQIGDVEIGNVSLQAGLNTLKFSRTDSYNMAIAGFVIAFDA